MITTNAAEVRFGSEPHEQKCIVDKQHTLALLKLQLVSKQV